MSDCTSCPVAAECHYPFKPCDCFEQRKFWTAQQRAQYDRNYPLFQADRGQFAASAGGGNAAFGERNSGGTPE